MQDCADKRVAFGIELDKLLDFVKAINYKLGITS